MCYSNRSNNIFLYFIFVYLLLVSRPIFAGVVISIIYFIFKIVSCECLVVCICRIYF